MKKKRLISVMLAGVVTAGMLSVAAGCTNKTENIGNKELYLFDPIEDVNIVLEEKNEKILHKGDVSISYYTYGYSGGTCNGVVKHQFDCGRTLLTNATYYLYDDIPNESEYDDICEECFNQ